MKINEADSNTNDYTRKLDNKIRYQNSSKEAELENLKIINDKQIEDVKKVGEEKYIAGIKKNETRLASAAKDYEEKLNNYKNNLEKTQKTIALEENLLKENHSAEMQNARGQFLNNINEQYKSATEEQEAIHRENIRNVQATADKTRTEKSHLEFNAHKEIMATTNELNQKGLANERNFSATLSENSISHENQLRQQKEEFKNISDKNLEKNKRIENQKAQVQQQDLNFLENHQRDLIKQKQADFKVRYEKLIAEHENILNELKNHLSSDVKKMLEQTSTQKKVLANKVEDQFYRIQTINPTILDGEKNYFVSLKIPEHEKENVHLSVRDRNIKMTLSRKFSDILESDDGSTNKNTRNELFSREFDSKDLLNSKGITQKYENGTLTFKIAKL